MWLDVEIKSSPNFPWVDTKEATIVLLQIFLRMAIKVGNYLGYFGNKKPCHGLSKVAQYGHTAYNQVWMYFSSKVKVTLNSNSSQNSLHKSS